MRLLIVTETVLFNKQPIQALLLGSMSGSGAALFASIDQHSESFLRAGLGAHCRT